MNKINLLPVDIKRELVGLKLTSLLHVEGKYMAYKFLLP